MKKLALLATALAMVSGSALAADMRVKAVKAPPPPAFDPWDIAFGAGITNDYIFRGITQSNHKPSVNAYFEPRYNVTKDFQLYVGLGAASISFPNRAAAEVDAYGGARLTVGQFAFDVGAWGYLYPGGTCQYGAANAFNGGTTDAAGVPLSAECLQNALVNSNVLKKDVSFFEVYGKVNYTFNDNFSLGGNVYYTPSFLNSGAEGTYASIVGKAIAPTSWFGSSGIGMYVSGEFGRQWLGTSDSFYGTALFPNGINYADYNTWNVGVGFTYKVFTLDFRYSDTNLSKGDCNAFTSDFSARGNINGTNLGTFVTPINPSGVGSNWCGAAGIVKLSADLTAMTNLK
ncbi:MULTISPECIES: TorF family putative porin [unclassified Bradyrhizobium]|uniref:TorF family putative porin n=1 Tax=unclassified Bradyrhizobium TaxID=2631580 RepID=UPI002FF037DD